MRAALVLLTVNWLGALACDNTERPVEISTAGSAGAPGTPTAGDTAGAAGVPTVSPIPQAGREWLLLGFEDPVGIALVLSDDGDGDGSFAVAGQGCYDGPVRLDDHCRIPTKASCVRLGGRGSDDELEFSMTFDAAGLVYSTHAHVSVDGTRMAGGFSSGPIGQDEPVFSGVYGWLRADELVASSDCSLRPKAAAGFDPRAWATLPRCYRLEGDVAVGTLQAGETYCVRFANSFGVQSLTGALGAFHNGDYSWDESTMTLSFGPVAPTVPHAPIGLEMHFSAPSEVADVVATTAEGESGRLVPVELPAP
jgi:hypothetical protein